jgi:hypothetical protein
MTRTAIQNGAGENRKTSSPSESGRPSQGAKLPPDLLKGLINQLYPMPDRRIGA